MEKGTAIEKFVKYMLITNKSLTTIETYERDVRIFLLAIAENEVDLINRGIIEGYFSQLAANGTKNSVIKKKYASIKAFIKFLVEQGIIAANPLATLIKMPKNLSAKQLVIAKDYLEQIIHLVMTDAKIIHRDKLIIVLILVSGMSAVELANYRTKDRYYMEINQSISEETRGTIQALLDNYLAAWSHEMLFLSGRSQPLTYKYIRRLVSPYLQHLTDMGNLDNFYVTIDSEK
ncbi:MAG: site-specific integrase [Clostridia bacterium]|jgi:site-specific recombinase XerD|nr:site-specific integrase [Clostridia bacterium]